MLLKKLVLISTCLLATSAFAVERMQYVVAPYCLMKHVQGGGYKVIGKHKDLTLAALDKTGMKNFIDAKTLQKDCGGFFNVTSEWNAYRTHSIGEVDVATFIQDYAADTHQLIDDNQYQIQYEKQVKALLPKMNPQNMWNDLTHLTNYSDRFANSDTGVQTANWIKEQVEAMAKANDRTDVTATIVATCDSSVPNCDKRPDYKQPSVVVKLGTGDGPGIVIGGHMDTTETNWWQGKKPGADDDGTGSVTVLEVARTLIGSGMNFKRPIYFMWYAAEEEGLVGSKYVVKYFKNKNIPVYAVLHMDMTGYAMKTDPETMWLVNDNVSSKLTEYLKTLITTYVKKPIKDTRCGYACSDHASWTRGGVPSAIAFEADVRKMNPSIHTSNDTMDKLSLDHMADFGKMAVAFGVELAEPTA